MAGRFPLYTDNNVRGPVVSALRNAGWDVVRGVDTFPQEALDLGHFTHAAQHDRVLVSNDLDMKVLAEQWLAEGRSFRGLVWWPPRHYARMSASQIVAAFESLARQDEPFLAYRIVCLSPGSQQETPVR